MLLRTQDQPKKKFYSMADLEAHWQDDCEAFQFFCPTCGKQYKKGQHNCKQELKKEKKSLQSMLVLTKDELLRLEKEYEKLDKAQLEKIKRMKSAEFNELFEEFFLNIFMWMGDDDRQECLKDCEKIL